jgi:HSP20 family protein
MDDDLFTIPIIRNPFTDLLDMRRQVLDIFDSRIPEESQQIELREGGDGEALTKKREEIERWDPRCDVEEKEGELVIRAELPGLKKEELKIEYDEKHGILSISGEKKHEKEESKDTPKEKYHYIERRYGSFERAFRLPAACKSKIDGITAKSVDGVLEVHCPKETVLEESKTPTKRSIEIN